MRPVSDSPSLPLSLSRYACPAGFALLVTLTCLALFAPALAGKFFFDDYNSLMNNRGVVSPLVKNPRLALQALKDHPLRPDRSLAWLTFAASYRLGGLNPAAFRAVNLALHGLTSLLLFLLLSHLLTLYNPGDKPTGKIWWPTAAGGFFFLCHPLALNTVLYACQRFGGLAAFFYLTGFYAWLKGREKDSRLPTGKKPLRWPWFLLATAAFWGAIHSLKPTGIPSRSRWIFAMAGLAIAGSILLFAWKIGLFNRAWINIGFRSQRLWSPWIQFLSESRAFLVYWKLLFLPWPGFLSLHHPFAPTPANLDPASLTATGIHLAILCGAWRIRRRAPLAGLGVFWFYLVMGPPYLLLPQRELLVEYKTYLAAPGAAMIVAGLLQLLPGLSTDRKISFPAPNLRHLAGAFILAWLLGLAVITWHRRSVFSSPVSAWSDVLRKYPDNQRALNNRASVYLRNRNPESAMKDLNRLIRSHPGYIRGYENRGRLKFYLGDFRGAAIDLSRALRLLPANPRLEAIRRELKNLRDRARMRAAAGQ